MAAKTVVPDTSFFMQCRLPQEVDWSLLNLGEEIELAVPPPVQREINNFKTDPNGRRSKRARKLSAMLADAALNPPFVIRDKAPRVTLTHGPKPWKPYDGADLNLTIEDEAIAAYALAIKGVCGEVTLLTGDSYMISLAVRESIPLFRFPDEWLPSDELDAKDRRIRDLEQELAILQQTYPKVSCAFIDAQGQTSRAVQCKVRTFRPLSSSDVGRLVGLATTMRPIAPNVIGPGALMQHQVDDLLATYGPLIHRAMPPSAEQIKRYQDRYHDWMAKLPPALENVHRALTMRDGALPIGLTLINAGGAPAENVMLELSVDTKRVSLAAVGPEGSKRIFAAPPEVPKGARLGEATSHVSAIRSMVPEFPAETDLRKFHWERSDKSSSPQRLAAHCHRWRHESDPTHLMFYAIASDEGAGAFNAVIRCRITADNLPKAATTELAFQVSYTPADATKIAERVLLEDIMRRDT